MNIVPTLDNVLVKVHANSDTSEGGIFTGMATTSFVNGKEKATQETVGEVISVGKGRYDKKGNRRALDVPVGSFVCFSDTCGIRVDDDHLMIREQDIAFFMDEPTTVELIYK